MVYSNHIYLIICFYHFICFLIILFVYKCIIFYIKTEIESDEENDEEMEEETDNETDEEPIEKKQNKSMIQVHFTRMLSLKTYFCLITFLLIYDSFPFSPNSNTYYSTNSGFNIQEEKKTTQEKKQVAAGG